MRLAPSGHTCAVKLPTLVAAYYSAQRDPQRTTLLELRERVLRVIPDADEVIKYAMPTFIVDGQPVCGLMAHSKHISLYPYSGSVLATVPQVTAQYGGAKSALHLPIDQPAPLVVIRPVINAKLELVG